MAYANFINHAVGFGKFKVINSWYKYGTDKTPCKLSFIMVLYIDANFMLSAKIVYASLRIHEPILPFHLFPACNG